jgi:hypothetical protein
LLPKAVMSVAMTAVTTVHQAKVRRGDLITDRNQTRLSLYPSVAVSDCRRMMRTPMLKLHCEARKICGDTKASYHQYF